LTRRPEKGHFSLYLSPAGGNLENKRAKLQNLFNQILKYIELIGIKFLHEKSICRVDII